MTKDQYQELNGKEMIFADLLLEIIVQLKALNRAIDIEVKE